MSSEHRHRPRKNTPHLVRVLDSESGKPFGRVVDITADGMMLVTEEPIAMGTRFKFRINLPVMVHYRTDVEVEAEAMWTTPDANPSFVKTGFQFINLSGDDGFLLEDVMHKLNLIG